MPSVDPLRLLVDLVRLPSVNPMGWAAPNESPYYEHRVTAYLESLLHKWRLPTERIEVHPDRDNLIARLEGTTDSVDRPLILLEVHQDTVPVEGMTIDPFAAEVRDGRLYGRGACDVKGGMAAMLAALARLAEMPHRPCDVVLACVINEEFGFTGATSLVKTWAHGQSKILPRMPDAIIVAEPTLLDVVVAHKGVVRWRCTTLGKAGHSSRPERGENAIYAMARVISALEGVAQSVASIPADPWLGSPSLSVGTIEGGVSVNTIPDRCTIEIDRRLLPTESPSEAYEAAIAATAANLTPRDRIEHAPPFITSRGLPSDKNSELAARLGAIARQQGAFGKPIGVPFGTDAAAFAAAGASVVVFGPGDIAQAHTADEWIELQQVEQAAEILTQFCRNYNAPST